MTVRYRLRGDLIYRHTELVGVVQSVTDADGGRVTIIDRKGATHVVPVPEIVASKLL